MIQVWINCSCCSLRHLCGVSAELSVSYCAVQEHYCVAVGVNDATGALNNFGFMKKGALAGLHVNGA